MWGEDWGTMIWGGGSTAAIQIPFGPWALILLGFILGVCAVYANRSRIARVVPAVMVLMIPVVSVIALNLPHVFQNNTIADANEVNANFQALSAAVDDAAAKVSAPIVYNANNTLVTKFFEQSDLDQLCADEDGCLIRLCKRSLSGSLQDLVTCNVQHYHQSGTRYGISELNSAATTHNSNGDGFKLDIMTTSPCVFADSDNLNDQDTGTAMRLYRAFTTTNECVLRFYD